MTRPLFWAVSMFALGEVTYFISDRVMQVSIIFIMLIFLVFIYKKNAVRHCIAFFFFYLLGIGYIAYYSHNNIVNILCDISCNSREYNVECGEKQYEEKKYTIFLKDKNDFCFDLYCQGVVWDVEEGQSGASITVQVHTTYYMNHKISKSYKVLLYGINEKCKIGDSVCISGIFLTFSPSLNPGSFDLRKYYNSRDVWLCTYDCQLKILGNKENGIYYNLKKTLFCYRKKLCHRFNSIANAKIAGIYSGILLGEKKSIGITTRTLYRLAGIAHVLSISGLHVTMIGGGIYKLLRKIGISFSISGIVSIVSSVLYGIMTGMGLPTLRAVIMLTILIVGEILGKNYDILTSMMLALFLVLISNPYLILDGGLQLSFVAIFGVALAKHILWLILRNTKIKRKLKKKPILYSLTNSVVMSVSVSIMMLPVILKLYFQVSPYSFLLNLIVVPLMTIVVVCGLLALVVSCFSIDMGKLVLIPGKLVMELYELLCRTTLKLPFGNIVVGNIALIQIILYYALLVVTLILINEDVQRKIREYIYIRQKVWMTREKWHKIMGVIIFGTIISAFLLNGFIFAMKKDSQIIFLDVGQGDGAMIITENGYNIMVDGGSSSNENMGEYTLVPALKYYGIKEVDYWFISHWDKDHVSGLEYILSDEYSNIKIKNIVTSYDISGGENLVRQAKEKEVNIIYVKRGEYFTDGSFNINILYPAELPISADRNNNSLVFLYRENNLSALFTGDVGEDSLDRLYRRNISHFLNNIDILKVPHHGSKYSVHYEWLEYISPDISVISAGKNNIYGHPHEDTLSALNYIKSKCYITKDLGAIIIKVK